MTFPTRLSRVTRSSLSIGAALAMIGTGFGGAAAIGAGQQSPAPKTPPDIVKLAGALADQELTWEECGSYGVSAHTQQILDAMEGVACADVTVPVDWHDAQNSGTLTVRISQALNSPVGSPGHKGTILVNPGGPGGPGLAFGPIMNVWAPSLADGYNFVGMDPRGVGQSTKPSCEIYFEYDFFGDQKQIQNDLDKLIADTCSNDPVVSKISTEQTTYDMDLIRHLLGEKKLSYIGYSYGTWLGTWYANEFGANTDKILLDSATATRSPSLEATWDEQPYARDRQFTERMVPYASRVPTLKDTYGRSTEDILTDYYFLADNPDPEYAPIGRLTAMFIWVFGGGMGAFPNNYYYPDAARILDALTRLGAAWRANVEAGLPPTGENYGQLNKQLLEEMSTWPNLSADRKARLAEVLEDYDSYASFEEIAAELLAPELAEADAAQTAEVAEPDPVEWIQVIQGNVYDPFDAIRCNDGEWTQGDEYWDKAVAKTLREARFNTLGFVSAPRCRYWKSDLSMDRSMPKTFPSGILAQAEMDSQTGWNGAQEAGLKQPNTHFVALDNEGSHGIFPYGTECVDKPILDYFLTGNLPKKDATVCSGEPLRGEDKVYENWAPIAWNGKHRPGNANPGSLKRADAAAVEATKAELLTAPAAEQAERQLLEEVSVLLADD